MLHVTHTQLGSILGVCLEGDCQVGEMLIRQMQSTFQAVANQEGDLAFNIRAQVSPAVTAVVEDYLRLKASWSRQLPFTPICCRMAELGKQAQALTQTMHRMAGTTAPPTTSTDSDPFGGFMTFLKVAAAVTLVALVAPPVIRAAGEAISASRAGG